MAQASLTEEDIPEGKVDQVCREWLVREDNAIAYRLQDEEINQFYEGNRFKNKVFRSDLEQAKYIQEKEEFERMMEYERERQRIADEDERIAKEIQEALIEEERRKTEELNHIVEEDEKLAQRLQEKEKERLKRKKLQRERLQVEKIRLEKFGSLNPDLLEAVNRTLDDMDNCESWNGDSNNPIPGTSSSSSGYNEADLSEFCMKPPLGLSDEEMRVFMSEQDEELARFLQQYETKRKAALLREKKQWIEAQDYEIARILQEEERARAKRAREKAKQLKAERERARRAEQEAINRINGDDANSLTSTSTPSSGGHYYASQQETAASVNHYLSSPSSSFQSADYDQNNRIEETSLTINSAPEANELLSNHSQDADHEYDIHRDDNEEGVIDDYVTGSLDLAKRDLPPIPSFHNVAMDLDPTYKRRQKSPTTNQKSDLTGVHFAQLCRVSPCSSPSQSPTSSLSKPNQINDDFNNQIDYDDSLAYLAYQPVQGQRRITTTTEKRSKKSRDGCRTQ